MTMKKLTRIKLVNWHYFADETINIGGSCLISGENSSGKSTILDAIQLVLTTSSKHFNSAANEKSRRDLRGYVRCKTGIEGKKYIRSGQVIAYVALEFYDLENSKTFTIGVKLDSPDEDGDVNCKWFCEEAALDDFSFTVDGKPALDAQFLCQNSRVNLYNQQREARDRFKRRLGNLDDTFFKLIPKAMAFKPIDRVKDFICSFVLPEKQIDIDGLKGNISAVQEFQAIVAEVKRRLEKLKEIHRQGEKLAEFDEKLAVVNALLLIAKLDELQTKVRNLREQIEGERLKLGLYEKELHEAEEQKSYEDRHRRELELAIDKNGVAQLLKTLEQESENLTKNLDKAKRDYETFCQEQKQAQEALRALFQANAYLKLWDDAELLKIKNSLEELDNGSANADKRLECVCVLKRGFEEHKDKLDGFYYGKDREISDLKVKLSKLSDEIKQLSQNKMTYPEHTVELQRLIKEEFLRYGFADEQVGVLAELLEIVDQSWQNALEGYLNTQRFAIIVPPEHYDIAARVYERSSKQIHSVFLVNTGCLPQNEGSCTNMLAAQVSSSNPYAQAYANYLLGRVRCCERVEDLKQHSIAITKSCMLYQGHALRRLDPKVYEMPFIGKHALKFQLEAKKREYEQLSKQLNELERQYKKAESARSTLGTFNAGRLQDKLSSRERCRELESLLRNNAERISEAKKDPTIIELDQQLDDCMQRLTSIEKRLKELHGLLAVCGNSIKEHESEVEELCKCVDQAQLKVTEEKERQLQAVLQAEEKYNGFSTTVKSSVEDNYSRRRTALQNQRSEALLELKSLQKGYRNGEYGTGEAALADYERELDELTKRDLAKYEAKLREARHDCELEFREHFLAKMRENITNAERLFKDLNRALKPISYGNDSYSFSWGAEESKKKLYEMITSNVNVGGDTLFSDAFEEEYSEEIKELFGRLTQDDENGQAVIREYTDYRSYLTYDIQIISITDNSKQLFSKICREKSGGETQTPYYVAIAASFSQIYSSSNSIRLIMFDEAFDKMDDDRIASMMEFFKSLNLQVILATPPAKMDVIGEHVDTILLAERQGMSSVVEGFDFSEQFDKL